MARMASIIGFGAALALLGCSEADPVLTGERLGVREVLETRADPSDIAPANMSRAIALGAQRANADWAQSEVSAFARVNHAAFSGAISPVLAVDIGRGDKRRNRIIADPIVAQGRVFTMDSANLVSAVSTAGELLWTFDLTPLRDREDQAQGGGFAYDAGRLYVASGFGTVTALDPATGAEIWSQRLGSTATGAPSVRDGVVYIVSGDTIAWALEADNGRIRWQIEGVGDVNNVAGAPAPAIGERNVFFSFGGSTVQAAFRQGGLRLWNADILGRRNGVALSGVDDLTGDPLIDGETLYAGTHSGRLVALSVYDGERRWTAREGALGPVWPAGDSVFFVSDLNRLIRLDAGTGEQIWAVDLPGYKPNRNPNRRRDRAYANHGPILAGGRLIVASSDGFIRAFSPEDGSLVSRTEIPGGATTRPVVAGGVLYVVSGNGVLHGYR